LKLSAVFSGIIAAGASMLMLRICNATRIAKNLEI
jgi:hypothetical protein